MTDGIGGVLAGVELFTQPGAGSDNVTVSIGLGSGFFTGSFAFTEAATITQSGIFIDASASDIVLTPGETFVTDFSGGSKSPGVAALSTTYANGDLFVEEIGGTVYNATTGQNLSGGPNLLGTPGTTMAFETFIEGSSAPEPGTLALFGGGLFGLHWMKRRRAVRLGLRPTTK